MMKYNLEDLNRILYKNKIFLLYGDLGAGKTHLIRQLVGSCVQSPTYVGYYVYSGEKTICNANIWHGDLYIKQPSLEEIIDIIENYDKVFFEWPEKFHPSHKNILNQLPHVEIFLKNQNIEKIIYK